MRALDWIGNPLEQVTSSILKINAPNGLTIAVVSATTVEAWLKVAMLLTSIVCTILMTRAEIKRKNAEREENNEHSAET